ncbi:MAG: hypothetical protein RL398_2772 [Planctomycetota bacterium]|jgi:signal transduction histidine kinase/ActR/RegA family two-component response regulator
MSIRSQLLLTIGLVAVLPTGAFLHVSQSELEQEVHRVLDRELQAVADRNRERVEAFLTDALDEVRSLAELPSMARALSGSGIDETSMREVSELLAVLRKRAPSKTFAAGLVAWNGDVLLDADPLLAGRNESDRSYLSETLQSNAAWLGFDRGLTTQPALVCAAPVVAPEGTNLGVFRIAVAADSLGDLLWVGDHPATDSRHDLALFDRDHRLVAHAGTRMAEGEWSRATGELLDAAGEQAFELRRSRPHDSADTLGRAHSNGIPKFDWHVVAWQPEADYTASAAASARQRWLSTLVLVVLMGAAAWLSSRWVAVPLQRIAAAAARVGRGDLDAEIPEGKGEVGMLGHAIGEMRNRLTATMRQAQASADAAQTASAAKSQFLANMSHELRTPLAAILGYAELGSDEAVPAGQLRRHAATIHRNAQHLLGLVNEVLDMAKIESGTVELLPVDFDPLQVCREALELVQGRADSKGLRLVAKFDSLPGCLRADSRRIKQILINLLGNAIKFTESGYVQLCVGVAGSPARLTFEVTDTGPGIEPSVAVRLFEPFAQADASAARRNEGTGLGLAISRRLARRMGGDLVLRSMPGAGSTFTLTIPAEAPSESVLAQPATSTPHARLQGRILLVEDGADNRRLLTHILHKVGLEVVTANDGLRGVAMCCIDENPAAPLLEPPPFDLVLMDMQMPVMDGVTATKKLRDKGMRTPIVALTAHAMQEAKAACLEAGCDAWETKPIAGRKLIDVCAKWLSAAPAAADTAS